MQSFSFQADRFMEGETPTTKELNRVFSIMKGLYKQIITPKKVLEFDRDVLSTYLRQVLIPTVKREASPGSPYSKDFRTNGSMIDSLGEHLVTIVIDRLQLIMEWNGEFSERKDLIEMNLMDPVRLFIKNEPHSLEKCKLGRFRLIMSVSLIDKLVEMIFHYHTNKQQIMNWKDIPSKPGMGFTLEMSDEIYTSCKNQGFSNLAAADVSGWDWSVKDWLLKAEAEFRIILQSDVSEFYCSMLRKRAIIESNSIYQFSDGSMVECDFPGLQNSGKYNTSSGNSHMRIIVAMLVGSEWGMAMGDDCIETFVPNALDKYQKYGFRVKMYDTIKDQFEFCSHIFTEKGAYTINENKSLMRLFDQDGTLLERKLLTMQFEDDVLHHPEYESIMGVLDRVGWYTKICQQKLNKL